MLREHRVAMRVMEDLIEEEFHDGELEDRMMFYTGSPRVFLGHCNIRDETSDHEDPEATLRDELAATRQELAEKSSFIEAVSGALQCNRVTLDLERKSMMLEDVLSQQLR